MTRSDESPAGDGKERGLIQPTRRERTRPLELLGLSAVFAAFAGVVTLSVVVAFGATFVVSLVVLAMFSLGGYEPPQEPPSNVLGGDPH